MSDVILGNLLSKTAWFSFALMILGAAQEAGLYDLIPSDHKGGVLSVVGFITLILRNLTKGSVTDKVVGPK